MKKVAATVIAVVLLKLQPMVFAAGMELEFTKAVVALARGDAATAEGLLRGVLSKDPGNLSAMHYLGKALAAQGRLDEARSVLVRLLAKDASRARARLDLAVVLAKLGLFEKAERQLLLARKELAGSASFHYYLGYCLYRAGKYEKAIEQLERSRKLGQGFYSPATYYLGLCHAALGRRQSAEKLFLELAGEERVDTRFSNLARQNLQALSTPQRGRTWWLRVNAGAGWDSNVTLDTQDPGNASAAVAFVGAAGGWSPALWGGRFDALLSVFRSFHTTEATSGYDLTSSTIRLGWRRKLGMIGVLAGLENNLQFLDGTPALRMDGFGLYMHSHAAKARLQVAEASFTATGIEYTFRAGLFHSGLRERDNFHHEGTLSQSFHLFERQLSVYLRGGVYWEDARHAFYDQFSPILEIAAEWRPEGPFVFAAQAGWQRVSYYRTERLDNRLWFQANAMFSISDWLALVAGAAYLDNDSSPLYDYDRWQVSFGVAGGM